MCIRDSNKVDQENIIETPESQAVISPTTVTEVVQANKSEKTSESKVTENSNNNEKVDVKRPQSARIGHRKKSSTRKFSLTVNNFMYCYFQNLIMLI